MTPDGVFQPRTVIKSSTVSTKSRITIKMTDCVKSLSPLIPSHKQDAVKRQNAKTVAAGERRKRTTLL